MSISCQNLNNPNVIPSKRKLDDYAPPSFPGDYESLAAMARRQPQFNITLLSSNPNPNPTPDADQSRVRRSPPSPISSSSLASSSGSPLSFSSSMVQFFIRTTDSKTLVFHASLHSTVSSLVSRLSGASSDLRLICNGRQLDPDSTLKDSNVKRDSTLHLSARLRSTRLPRSCRLVSDLLHSCSLLSSGLPLPRYAYYPADLVLDFLADSPPKKEHFDADAAGENARQHFRIFLDAAAPAVLIKLYLSDRPGCSFAAECAVNHLLKPESDVSPKTLEMLRAPVIFELSKLLAASAGPDDHLYLKCRSALAPLAESISKDGMPKLAEQLYPFVSELAGAITNGLSADPVFVSPDEIAEFAGFLVGIRRAIRDAGPVPKSLLEDKRHSMYESWISALHTVFVKLLMKLDECLEKVASFLEAMKPVVQIETLLAVLTCVHKFSKVYEGGHELLHDVLCRRKDSVNALSRLAKRNKKLKWLLRHRDVTDFEARQNLALMLFPDGEDDFHRMHEMLIDRSQLLAESFEYIGEVEAHSLHGELFMEFKSEEATGPGVLREWFCLVCRAIFNSQNVLFLSCPNDQRRFFPNPASAVDPLHLKYFGFCGRLIALALMHKVQVGVVFDRVFYFQLAGKPITLEDIKDADPCLYMSCKKNSRNGC